VQGDDVMKISVSVSSEIKPTARVRQLEGMFDCPVSERQEKTWTLDAPIEDFEWNIGMIVGPSGAGKSTVARSMFGDLVDREVVWSDGSVIDGFSKEHTMSEIADICRAVGFNTIPAWMRPFHVLSTGEKFRVELARRLIDNPKIVVVDEFTSVVDRQVAKIGSAAVAKFVRRNNRKFVAVGCHYDVIDWLQPDWVIEPHSETFTRRSVRRRPTFNVKVVRASYSEWARFAPFHYMNADLNRSARCFVGLVEEQPAVFCAMLHRPHAKVHDIWGLSRLVTLPDYQGLGVGPAVTDVIASAYKAVGRRFRTYPAHPALVRSFDKSPNWRLEKKPGIFSPKAGKTGSIGDQGGRPCAVFEWVGSAMSDLKTAQHLVLHA
jgi:energy-coupling factor transporter ATP-binding protein EcfA2/GNAT superfamily N-acetyltransferase